MKKKKKKKDTGPRKDPHKKKKKAMRHLSTTVHYSLKASHGPFRCAKALYPVSFPVSGEGHTCKVSLSALNFFCTLFFPF